MVAVAVAAMGNPFQFISEIREMNDSICERLDLIASLIDDLIVATKENKTDWYGDGK